MQRRISLKFPAKDLSHSKAAVLQAGFEIEEYLSMVLKAIGSPHKLKVNVIERIFHLLPDELVLSLAKVKMPEKTSRQHVHLLRKSGEGKINTKEGKRLRELAEEYERGTLRKAFALAEAVRRGLMASLDA